MGGTAFDPVQDRFCDLTGQRYNSTNAYRTRLTAGWIQSLPFFDGNPDGRSNSLASQQGLLALSGCWSVAEKIVPASLRADNALTPLLATP